MIYLKLNKKEVVHRLHITNRISPRKEKKKILLTINNYFKKKVKKKKPKMC